MGIKIFSFLGTTIYKECNYKFEDNIKIEGEKFFQIALARYLKEHKYKDKDVKSIVFCTKKSIEENLICIERKNFQGEMIPYKGLQIEVEERGNEIKSEFIFKKNINIGEEEKDIPIGSNSEDMWSILQMIFEEIENGDEIVFDVTHGFRCLPLLALVVLNYAKYVQNIKIRGIYYGAFEAKSPELDDTGHKVINEYGNQIFNSPAFDISGFNLMIDWIIAMEKYLSSGESNKLKQLVKESNSKVDWNGVSKEEIKKLTNWIDKNDEFSKSVFICQSHDISKIGNEIREGVDEAKYIANRIMPALDKAMEKIENKFNGYKASEIVNNVHETVKWCSEHDMLQQGYTLLRENIITYVYENLQLDKSILLEKEKDIYEKNPKNKKWIKRGADVKEEAIARLREHIQKALIVGKWEKYNKYRYHSISDLILREELSTNNINKKDFINENGVNIFLLIWNSNIHDKIYDIFKVTRAPRNAINHAGYIQNKGMSKKKYKTSLQEVIEDFSKIINV